MQTGLAKRHVRRTAGGALLAFLMIGVAGCADRRLTIELDDYVNTANQAVGEPLDVDIVVVVPTDFEGEHAETNKPLKPGGNITSRQWFENRPTRDSYKDPESINFRIPSERIISYTDRDKSNVFGKKEGPAIQGQVYMKKKNVKVSVPPPPDIWAEDAAIYVFCRFSDVDGSVLSTEPAVFHRVGDYVKDISARIEGKRIVNTSTKEVRKDRGSKEEDGEEDEE